MLPEIKARARKMKCFTPFEMLKKKSDPEIPLSAEGSPPPPPPLPPPWRTPRGVTFSAKSPKNVENAPRAFKKTQNSRQVETVPGRFILHTLESKRPRNGTVAEKGGGVELDNGWKQHAATVLLVYILLVLFTLTLYVPSNSSTHPVLFRFVFCIFGIAPGFALFG